MCIRDRKDTGKPNDLLEALYLILDTLEEDIKGKVADTAEILGRVHIGEGTEVLEDTIIRGPVYIGKNCRIGPNTFIGPYTAIENNVEIRGGEILGSLIMDNAKIELAEDSRIIDSIIGAKVTVKRKTSRKRGLKLVLGETSIIEL